MYIYLRKMLKIERSRMLCGTEMLRTGISIRGVGRGRGREIGICLAVPLGWFGG